MTTERPDLIAGSMATVLQATRLPSFLGAPWVACDTAAIRAHGARAAILGVPFDQATVYRSGSSHGPRGLRQASEQYLPYLGEYDIDLFEEFRLVDCGDVPVVPGDAARSRRLVAEYVGRILDAGAFPILVGGDHSIPIPAMDAVSARVDGRVGYLHFDAHLDCQPDVAGERFTNWSGVARAVERDNVDPRNVALVGIRGALNPPEQFRFVREHGIAVFTMREIGRRGIEAVVADALERVTDGTAAFYVTWDTDVIDAAAMPGTDGPEPGGLTSGEALRAIELVGARRPIAMDIVELTPAYDPAGISTRLACYLIFDVLGGWATGGQPRR
ncbi:MAG TPA: agmatinase family protein [Candidatus Limnocylindrales bacterium]|nr:agmatinase family protein [Candidatus Limnocylindrales bacterium]